MAEDHGQLEVGHHDARTCPNCRIEGAFGALSEGDLLALEWFARNVTGFAIDSGMIPRLVEELGFEGVAKEVFLMKLNIIYKSIQDAKMKEMQNG